MRSSRFATAPEQRLIVFVPELEALLREALSVPPLIAAMQRLSGTIPLDPECPQAVLATGRPLAAAALSRRLDCPEDCDGTWLRADPVDLVPDLAAVWIRAEARFEAGEWLPELQALFAEEGMVLEMAPSGRGYLRLEAVPECRFTPPWALAGESLDHCLPEGSDARRWRRLLNETQVLLHQLRRRADHPDAVPASLWFWGGGALPDLADVRPRVRRIVADDPVLTGLAEWLGLPCSPPGAGGVTARAGDLFEWLPEPSETAERNLERLQVFLRPAWRQLRLGRLRSLEVAEWREARAFTPGHAWRAWR